jgi:hypothetical protein
MLKGDLHSSLLQALPSSGADLLALLLLRR